MNELTMSNEAERDPSLTLRMTEEKTLRMTEVKDLTPAQLGGEIRLLTSQARRMALSYAIQIGYRLAAAHEKVGPHGWAEWLKNETEFSAAAASRFEALYKGYGEDQGSLFGVENKFPTLENLSISNALRLLAVPEEEREEVAAEVDAEHLSARELEKALAERDEARRALGKAIKEKDEILRSAQDDKEKLETAIADAVRWEETAGSYASQVNVLQADLLEAGKRVKELESKPVEVAVERDEKAIREAAEDARKKAEEAAKAELDKLRKNLEKAEEEKERILRSAQDDKEKEAAKAEAEKARAEAEELRKKLLSAASGANVAATLFSLAQQNFAAALEKVTAMKATHPEVAGKLLVGMDTVLSRILEQVKEAQK